MTWISDVHMYMGSCILTHEFTYIQVHVPEHIQMIIAKSMKGHTLFHDLWGKESAREKLGL